MFRRQLTVALATLAVASVLQGGVAGWAVDAAAANVYRGRVASDVLAGFLELSAGKQRLRTWLSQALLNAGADLPQRDRLEADMAGTLERLRAQAGLAATLDGANGTLDLEHRQRQEALAVLQRSFDELRAAMSTVHGLPPRADAAAAWSEVTRVFDVSQGRDLRSLLDQSIARERLAVARERSAADRSLSLVRRFALGTTFTLALAAALLAVHFARALRRPLAELSDGADALQRGDLTHRIPAHRDDEFGRFAKRVNAMADELVQHRRREAEARQRLEVLVQARTGDLQQALQTMQQLDARRRQLFADISHELRTPTTAIRGEAEIALRGQEKPAADYRASLQRIVGVSQQLGTVIDDLLTMARSDIDTLALNREPLDVAEPLLDAIEQAQALGHEREVRVEAPPADLAGARVLGDAQRLRQLFTLLLDNAVRYSHPGGAVRIAATRAPPQPGATAHWQLRIADDGIGIGADALPRVFERHFRSDAARRHRGDGSGLGLPIAAALARAHGGRIAIDSSAGRGTVVTLHLPMLIESDEADSA